MTPFQGAGALFSLVAVLGYINYRFLRLPDTLGITAVGLIVSIGFSLLGWLVPSLQGHAQGWGSQINFSEIVFHGLLSPMLFASALYVDLSSLRRFKAAVFMLATAGVLISTGLIGVGLYYALQAAGYPLQFVYCLLFGALISPTDPIAVLAVLKNAHVPKHLEAKITGEALFNDGTAVVAFLTILGLATGAGAPDVGGVALKLVTEICGGIALGVAMGVGASKVLDALDSSSLEILVTLAVATAGYSIAEMVGVSGPLVVVAAGLVVGNHGVMSDSPAKTRKHLFAFWGLLDELLTVLLFGLIGLKLTATTFGVDMLLVGGMAVPVVLAARAASVAVPLSMLKMLREGSSSTVKIMTWGGMRGGISIALVLSLPEFPGKHLIVGATYLVVVFSLLVQATTLSRLVKRLYPQSKAPTASA